jgi:hypothetical protein
MRTIFPRDVVVLNREERLASPDPGSQLAKVEPDHGVAPLRAELGRHIGSPFWADSTPKAGLI